MSMEVMAAAQLGDDVSVVNDVDNSYLRRRCPIESGIRYPNVYGRIRSEPSLNGPEQLQCTPGMCMTPDLHSQRIEMARARQQESGLIVNSRTNKAENEVIYLRDKVSSLFRENCSLKEQAAKLGIDNRDLKTQATSLKQENTRLRERLHQISQQLKLFAQNKESQPTCVPTSHSGPSNLSRSTSDIPKLNSYKDQSTEVWNGDVKLSKTKIPNGSTSPGQELEQKPAQTLNSPVHDQTHSHQLQTLEALEVSNEEESRREKELLDMLETFQSNCALMKEAAQIQNKLLAAMVKDVSSVKPVKPEVPEELKIKLDQDAIKNLPDLTNPANSKLNIPRYPGSSVEHLIETYGAELAEWVGGEHNGTSSGGEYGENGSQTCDDDRICPMCQAVFPKLVPMLEFETHVMDHFKSDEFEIIGNDDDCS